MTRILSALILIPIALTIVIYAPPVYFLIGLGMVGTGCLVEYFRLVKQMGITPQHWLGFVLFWVLLFGLRHGFAAPALLALILLASFLGAMWSDRSMKDRTLGLMGTLSGVFYIGLFLYPALPLRFDFGNTIGLHWFILLLAVVWAGDSGALVVGKKFGRTLFAPRFSPKKTNEGAIGGLVAGILVAVLLQHFFFRELPPVHVVVVSVLTGMFGQLGDLAESMLKRAADVKDSSQLIPGHGGMLDRLDSLLFAFPVTYVYLLQLYS